ncbi:hypothetical protein [Thiorhodococcus fuscus]|uniref:Porin n=1 Tax=Thiorhodococcus fuscus TaxID=527200 RepID=A0ABW4YCV4_9GAMM
MTVDQPLSASWTAPDRKRLNHCHDAARPAILALLTLASPSGLCATDAQERHGFDWAVSVESELDLALNQAATNDGDIELFILGQWYFSNRTQLYVLYGNEIDYTETSARGQLGAPSHAVYKLYAEFNRADNRLRIGKFAPAFGNSWSLAKGVAAAYLAEDYELTDCLGASLARKTENGSLTVSLFSSADNILPADAVCKLGKNASFDAVGSYPDGHLNNVALEWNHTIHKGRLSLGARYLPGVSTSEDDELGGVASLLRQIGDTWSLYAEVAAFDGYQGTTQNAEYTALNTAYKYKQLTFSLTYAYRRLSHSSNTSLISIGVDYDWHSGFKLQTGLSVVSTAGKPEGYLSFDLIIPLRLPKYG